MEYSGQQKVRQYVKENREDLMKLVRHEETFLRALAFALLLEAGDDVDVKMAKRELELLEELDEEYDALF